MDSRLYERASALFLEASGLTPTRRDALLAARCGDDAALRAAVDQLLAHDEEPHALLGEEPGRGAAYLAHQMSPPASADVGRPESGCDSARARVGGRPMVRCLAASMALLLVAIALAAGLMRRDRDAPPAVAAAAAPPGDAHRSLPESERAETPDDIRTRALRHAMNGRHDEALSLLEPVWRERARTMGTDHPDTLSAQQEVAESNAAAGRLDDAAAIFRDLLSRRRNTLGAAHPATMATMGRLGEVYADLGRHDEAEPLLAEAIAVARETLPRGSAFMGVLLRRHARCLIALHRFEEAEGAALEAEAVFAGALGPTHAQTIETRSLLAELYESWGRPDEAARWRAKASHGPPPGP